MSRAPPSSTYFPYTTLFRSLEQRQRHQAEAAGAEDHDRRVQILLDLLQRAVGGDARAGIGRGRHRRSEEHTSELQSRGPLVCRLLLAKKKLPCASLRPVTSH